MVNNDLINNRLRMIPAIGTIIEAPEFEQVVNEYGKNMFKLVLNSEIDELRNKILLGQDIAFDASEIMFNVIQALSAIGNTAKRRVVNATGIILHTGLGRAPISDEAIEAIAASTRYTPVQSDPVTGKRSLREKKVEKLLRELTGAEAVTVVNNNAAATMLVLNTLANKKKVVISRGQLVEIGGAFRMPDVMEMSGAIMKEIGTTNRTHLHDYREAWDEEVGALMHVHTSNYRLRGFGGTPSIDEIVPLARELGVNSIDDIGSGALVSLEKWGIESEPLVCDSIAAGVDLCCFSGDKLIGAAQSGIICGKAEFVEQVRKNPFARMFRVDKLTLAALEATLAIWVNGEYEEKIPLYMMLSTPKTELAARAKKFVAEIDGRIEATVEVVASEAYIGSGSLPDSGVESFAVVLKLKKWGVEEGARLLRKQGVFARVSGECIWIDMIALLGGEVEMAVERVLLAFGK